MKNKVLMVVLIIIIIFLLIASICDAYAMNDEDMMCSFVSYCLYNSVDDGVCTCYVGRAEAEDNEHLDYVYIFIDYYDDNSCDVYTMCFDGWNIEYIETVAHHENLEAKFNWAQNKCLLTHDGVWYNGGFTAYAN